MDNHITSLMHQLHWLSWVVSLGKKIIYFHALQQKYPPSPPLNVPKVVSWEQYGLPSMVITCLYILMYKITTFLIDGMTIKYNSTFFFDENFISNPVRLQHTTHKAVVKAFGKMLTGLTQLFCFWTVSPTLVNLVSEK